MKSINTSLLMACAALSLAACSKTSEQFDFSKKAPDEFAVTTRAPLEMPPDYNLRPPRPGAPRPQEDSATEEAKQVVFGTANAAEPKKQKAIMTDGEAILLRKSGVAGIDPNIRDTVDRETVELIKEETPTVDRLLGKVGKKVDAPATIVDPIKESERILQNKEAGKPVTDGKTPTIEQ